MPGNLALLPTTPPGCGREARILIAGNQTTKLRRVLLTSHYDVTAARTGRESLGLSVSSRPDACIVELALPDMAGTEVIAELRRWYRHPIIALGGGTRVADQIGALNAGADQYVTEPFALDEILARLRAVLRRDRGNVIRGTRQAGVRTGSSAAVTREPRLRSG